MLSFASAFSFVLKPIKLFLFDRRSPLLRKGTTFLLFFLLLIWATPAFAGGAQGYLQELIEASRQKELSQQRYWHLLLHYRPTLLGGVDSEADPAGFFLAPDGKTNPQAELEATLAAFFSEELVATSKQPAQCAFIARYHWLKTELGIDPKRLLEQQCGRFDAWYAALNPQSLTLIFPSAYMNNPSSMFGHTLLRIDQKDQTEQTEILDYTVNYAATVTTDNGVLFAVLGITGGFKGNFSTIPYYLQVRKYSDMENRDIWEYRLNLTEEQIRRMLMHAWELGNTSFTYYFFKQNCSYQLLPLLEVANPDLHLTDSFWFWTIPADTVRLITSVPGLVGEITYRPARGTQIRQKRDHLSPGERRLLSEIDRDTAAAIESGPFNALPAERQAFLLDIAYDYTRYQTAKEEVGPESIKKKQRLLLARRSGLRAQSPEVKFTPTTVPPEQGHETARVGMGLGWREGEPFEELAVRPAYQDLLDDETGYTPGAQIELMNARLRYYNHQDKAVLHSFSFANIISLFPLDPLFKKPSWKVSVGLESLTGDPCRNCRYFDLNAGTGSALESHLLRRELVYFFIEADGNYGGFFDPNYRAGVGGTIGVLADLASRWKAHLFATYLSYPLGDRSHDLKMSLQQRVTLRKDLALRMELNRGQEFDQGDFQDEGLFTVHFYF